MPLQPSANTTNPLRMSEIMGEHTCTRLIYRSGTDTVTAPGGANFCIIKIWGGGGGGGAYNDTAAQIGQGGGGGAFVYKQLAVTGGSTTLTYSVGAGGAGGTGDGAGSAGGDTTITGGATLTAGGGSGGLAFPSGGGTGGSASGGDALSENGNSGTGNIGSSGGAEFGGGLAGYGAGGGGGTNPFQNGAAGENGAVIIEWYYSLFPSNKASQFYRDGFYVADNSLNSGIPTAGSFNLSSFLGTSAVALGPDVNLVAEVGQTANGQCSTSITFDSDGLYGGSATVTVGGTGQSATGSFTNRIWASGWGSGTSPSTYSIYAEVLVAGVSLSGTTNTWLQMNTTRTWTNSASASDDYWELRFKISDGTNIIDQMDVVLESNAAGIN